MEESKSKFQSKALAGNNKLLPDSAMVVLKVYLQKELFNCFKIDVKSVITMSLKVFRLRLGIPTKFSEYFTFAENSLFSKKIPHD